MNLQAQLARLEQAEIVRRVNDPDMAFFFKHAMTQETTYASLLKKTRRDIHSQVAHAIESQYADRLDEFAALLAQHYAAAEEDAKTLEFATRAGDANGRMYAMAEAIDHYTIAIDSAKRVKAPLVDLFVKRGRALELIGKYDQALTSYAEMEALALESNDGALELASLVSRATLFSTHTPLHDGQRGEDFSERALVVARKIGDRLEQARILWTQVLFHIYGSSDGQKAVDKGEQSLSILRELNAESGSTPNRPVKEQLAYTLNDMLYAYCQIGQLQRGLELRIQACELWRELDNKPMLADNLAGISIAQWSFGDAAAGLASADEAFVVAESVNNSWSMAQGRAMRGYALAELGRFGEAFAALHEADQFATTAETGGAMVAARCGLAFNYITLGMFERGCREAQRALEGTLHYIPDWHLWPQALLIRYHLMRGEGEKAELIAAESGFESPDRKLFKAFMPGVAAVVLADAELALSRKKYGVVLAVANDAFEYLRGSAPNYLPDLYLVCAQAHEALGNPEQCVHVLNDALEGTKLSRRMRWQVLSALSLIERRRGDPARAARIRDEARAEVGFISGNLTDEMRLEFFKLPILKPVI